MEYLSAIALNCFCAAFARSAIVGNVGPASSAAAGEPAGASCASNVRMAADNSVLAWSDCRLRHVITPAVNKTAINTRPTVQITV